MADDLSPHSEHPIYQLIPCIILHDFSLVCSIIISHPLYSSYFVFFAPYFIKLVSFVSPLFIAAVLLSVLLTTTTALCPNLPQLELGILKVVIQELKSNMYDVKGQECRFEDFEIYKMVFDGTLSIRIGDECDEEVSTSEKILQVPVDSSRRNDVTTTDLGLQKLGLEKILKNSISVFRINDATTIDAGAEKNILEHAVDDCGRNDVTLSDSDVVVLEEEKGLEKLFEELDRYEDCTPPIETCSDSDKVIEELRKAEPAPVKKADSGSEAINSSNSYNKISQISCRSSSWRSNSSSDFSSHGSIREEKEWRRTLACKLFEERHNSRGGEEGMDSLWEAHENDSSTNRKETMIKNNKMMLKNSIKVGIQTFGEEQEDDDEEPEMSVGHLCCLQALKLSTGKMNLGMGKPNLLKISKALRGFGWLHHVKKKKHGKKSYGVITN